MMTARQRKALTSFLAYTVAIFWAGQGTGLGIALMTPAKAMIWLFVSLVLSGLAILVALLMEL